MIHNDNNFEESFIKSFVISPINDASRGPIQFCHNLIIILHQKGNSPSQRKKPEKKKQILDHYLPSIGNITSQ